jgi:hypothetical protein
MLRGKNTNKQENNMLPPIFAGPRTAQVDLDYILWCREKVLGLVE